MTPEPSAGTRGHAFTRNLKRLLPWLLLVAALAVVPTWKAFAPVDVRTHRVERGAIVEWAYGRGTIEGDREAQLGFDLVGTLSDVLVDEGQRVRLGQELARLRPEKYAAELQTAASGVEAARAALGRLAAEELKARELLALALREERRLGALVQAQVTPTRDLDLARDASRLARAELDRVLGAQQEATRSIDVARGTSTERRVTELRATLLAPFDGLIVRRFRDPGDTVTVGASVLRLVDVEALVVRAWVDETTLPRLSEEQRVEVFIPAEPQRPYAGRVQRVGSEADRQTHELLVDVRLLARPPRVVIGQRADAWVALQEQTDALLLPLEFLQQDAEGSHVWLDQGGRIARRSVQVGLQGREAVQVTAGLAQGDVLLGAPLPGGTLPARRRWVERR